VKKAIIFYFSGTGNTEKVLNMLATALGQEGVQSDCYAMDDCLRNRNIPDTADYDSVGIGYPIYAFNVPSIVAAFIRKLPKADGKPVFVFKTAGEPFLLNRASSYYIFSHLRKKGYLFDYERHFLMPYNIMFRYNDEVVKQIYLLSQKLARKMASDLSKGITHKPYFNPLIVFVSFIFRIQWIGAAINGRLLRTGNSCSLCQKCVRECKTGNIRLEDGKIRFGWNCTMCMRCIMYCPQKAIRAGILEPWAIRGAYDFERILSDASIPGDYIQKCEKGVFKYFKKYVRETEAQLNDK
jgi:NAD-dependent dihydropyrimidine dehydrogenase PreA subunit